MLIILEGADGSGKTSLATRLRKELDEYCLFVRSSGPPTLEQMVDVISWLEEIPKRLPVIVDRHPLLSDYVYGPILRDKCLHGLNFEMMARVLSPVLVIYCRPPWPILEAQLKAETHLEGVLENHRLIVEAYDALMGELEVREVQVFTYDRQGPPDILFETIRTYIRSQKNG